MPLYAVSSTLNVRYKKAKTDISYRIQLETTEHRLEAWDVRHAMQDYEHAALYTQGTEIPVVIGITTTFRGHAHNVWHQRPSIATHKTKIQITLGLKDADSKIILHHKAQHQDHHQYHLHDIQVLSLVDTMLQYNPNPRLMILDL